MKKRIGMTLLAIVSALSFVCCTDKKSVEASDIADVWTATGTERILGDKDYSTRYGQKTLSIRAFQNEYESAQIIVSAKKDVADYDIEISDLQDTSGNVLPASAFNVFHEKYMYVGLVKNPNSPTGTGYYPDALLPFETAKSYDENRIEKNFNQGVWIELNVPQMQTAGVYSGNFTLTLDGQKTSVPVRVEVYDYALSDVVHSKSAFYLHPQRLAWGEMDDSIEMQEKYYEYLLNYRINPTHLPGNDFNFMIFDETSIDRFLNYAEKYTKDVRCSHFNIPYNVTTTNYGGQEMKCVDWVEFEKTLIAMAEYSAQKGVNLFEKAGTYFTFFDEYDITGTADIANYNLNYAYKLCEKLAVDLAGTLGCDTAFEQEILASLAGIKHKLVGSYTDDLIADKAQFVPTIDKFHTESGRAIYEAFDQKSYGDNGEMWTYTCMNPRPPSPTYHLDDTLTSSRLLGWMMYNYDIVGNLYWETVLYSYFETTAAEKELHLQDYYDTALRFPAANGDGYLLYPGRPYGIDGPVGSLRLQSIRDGNEDYDFFYALEELYATRGVTEQQFDALMGLLTRNLYSGTAVRISDGLYQSLAESRDMIAGLLTAVTHTGTVIESYTTGAGKAKFVLSAPAQTTLKIGDKVLTGTTEGEFVKYAVDISLDKAVNNFSLTAEKDGKNYQISLNLGGMNKTVSATTLAGKENMLTGGTSMVDTVDDIEVLRLDFATSENGLIADIDATSLNVTETAVTMKLSIYVYGDEDIKLTLRAKCVDASVYDEVTTVTLKAGWNEISVSTLSFGCQNYGMLKYLRFNPSGNGPVSIALGEFTIEG